MSDSNEGPEENPILTLEELVELSKQVGAAEKAKEIATKLLISAAYYAGKARGLEQSASGNIQQMNLLGGCIRVLTRLNGNFLQVDLNVNKTISHKSKFESNYDTKTNRCTFSIKDAREIVIAADFKKGG